MAFQNLFILGSTGNVGRELIRQVQEHDTIDKGHLNPTRIVGIADSKSYTLHSNGISTSELTTKYTDHDEILEAVKQSGLEGEVVFVDVTSEGPKMLEFHQKVIKETVNKIVTANKKPLVGPMDTFRAISSNPSRYLYNTTVMAGAAAVPYLQESHGLGEKVISISGVFSGTLGYICSELEDGRKSFSEIVRQAKVNKCTEPNPLDDLSGEDVKRKIIILLRSAGIRVEEQDVMVEGMIDVKKYSGITTDEFLEAIKEENEYFNKKVGQEKERGLVPRYIASYILLDNGLPRIQVGLKFVPKESELGLLKGKANKIIIHTSQRTPPCDNPHVIHSPGAGVVKTAAAVRSDLLRFLGNTNLYIHN